MAEKLLMLALSPTMENGIITRWLKEEGDQVESGDVLCEVETDKATMDYEAMTSGMLLKIILKEGESTVVGEPIAIIGKEGEDISSLLTETPVQEKAEPLPSEQKPAAKTDSAVSAKVLVENDKIRSSPLARQLARQHGLELGDILGSGPQGRIVKADVEQAMKNRRQVVQKDPSVSGDIRIPVSGKRRIIAQRLSESKFTAPHYYLRVRSEVDGILAARRKLNARAENKVSLNAYLIKFAAQALERHPAVNATWAGDVIIQHAQIDIGLAVAQKDGLITPVVRDCANKGLLEIDRELSDLVQRAQSGSLLPEEYSDATFTISSLGSFGIEEFTAIINPPGSAILAIGEIRKELVVQPDDSTTIKSLMSMTLSCDHRVVDGAVGAAFLSDLRSFMENPIELLY